MSCGCDNIKLLFFFLIEGMQKYSLHNNIIFMSSQACKSATSYVYWLINRYIDITCSYIVCVGYKNGWSTAKNNNNNNNNNSSKASNYVDIQTHMGLLQNVTYLLQI